MTIALKINHSAFFVHQWHLSATAFNSNWAEKQDSSILNPGSHVISLSPPFQEESHTVSNSQAVKKKELDKGGTLQAKGDHFAALRFQQCCGKAYILIKHDY